MMEGILFEGSLFISLLTLMGGISLYLVIATIVGKAVYSRTKNWDEDERLFGAIFCAGLFPISVPIIILVIWIFTIIQIPLGMDQEEEEEETTTSPKENGNESKTIEKPKPVKTKFKVGDLVTGVKGNPGGYEKFYEGCVCRVLEKDEDEINLKLVGHIDKEANEESFGRVSWLPQEHFTLIKPKESKIKKVAKKK